MLKHLLKVMARDYVAYILIFLIISTGLYAYYIVDASYMAADAVVEHCILDYKPHFTIKFIQIGR
ncbi:TPA: hypothetical protein EYP83_00340, partial [Candidatus Geothermarchaeota archaeon]|nr:hypothetical protein [Candidatus Geothermarchaeota archaeon]